TTSNTITVTVLPGQPGRPGVASDNPNDPHTSLNGLIWTSWGSASGATYYTLYQSKNGGTFTPLPQQYTTTPASFSGMGSYTVDNTYEYEAQACDSVTGLCGPMSAASASLIVTFLSNPPTNIAAQSTSYADGTFDVTWTAPNLGVVTQYNVRLLEFDTDNKTYDINDGIGCTASGSATTCRAGGENGTKYFVQVEACNVNECTDFYPQNPPYSGSRIVLPPINLNLSPNPTSSGNYTLSWGFPASVNSYTGTNVYESFNNGAYKYLGKTAAASWAFTGKANGSYRYMLTGCIQECGGGNSATITETVAVPPGTVTLQASSTQVTFDGHYSLSWGATGPVSSWTLQESDLIPAGWGAWSTIYSGSASSLGVADAITGSYRYRVQGCSSIGCSAWSNVVTVQVSSSGGGGGGGGGGTCPPTCQQVVKKPVGTSAAAWKPIRGKAQTTATGTQVATAQDGSTSTDDVTPVEERLHGSGAGRLTFAILSPPVHGSVTLIDSAEGRFVYVPASGYSGADAFTFDVSDANGMSNTAAESITVTGPVGAIDLPATAGLEVALAGLAEPLNAPDLVIDARSARLNGAEVEAGDTGRKLAGSAGRNPVPILAGHRAFAHLHPKFAPPVYAAYAHAHVVQATGTQVMARLQVAYGYTDTGYLNSLSNALSPGGRGAFWSLGRLSPDEEVTSATLGNGVSVTNQYDPMGRIKAITTTNGSGTIQANSYTWYNVGNLKSRQWQASDGVHNPQETFAYDVLNRLSTATLSGSSGGDGTVTTTYDVLGNITGKTNGGTLNNVYSYGGLPNAGPHAVTSVAGTVNGITNPNYSYDQNGNMNARAGTQVQWNSLNLPYCIDATGNNCFGGAGSSSLSYAPDKHRYQQVAVDGTGISETTVYVGGVDFLTNSATPTVTTARHMLSAYGENVLTLNIDDPNPNCSATQGVCFNYVHGDHLGGVDAVTDVNGSPISGTSFGYDAFGARRDPITGLAPTANQVQMDRSLTHRGFTKHEMLDNVNLVHMNGRVYDPTIGRFLSVDPVFAFPT